METSIKPLTMTLNKKALFLSYKILNNLGVENFNDHVDNVQRVLLTAFTEVYTKAWREQEKQIQWDLSAQLFGLNSKL